MSKSNNGPKILVFDIETTPLEVYSWGIWDQTIAPNQIKEDWSVLSWSAKWLGSPKSEIMYEDQRGRKNVRDDAQLLKGIHKLLDEADIVITQNGISFDSKKLNARFALNDMGPPSPYRHIDTKKIAKKNFAFTSNSLDYMTENLNDRYTKMKSGGFSLWIRCLAGELKAFKEMEEYNKRDVLSLEELYYKLRPWDNTVNFNVYQDHEHYICSCGSIKFHVHGYSFTNNGKFTRYKCKNCGKTHSSKQNLLSKKKRASLGK